MKRCIQTLSIIATVSTCFAGEPIKFDDNQSVREMLKLVKVEMIKGEKKKVNFSTGEFHLVNPFKGDENLQEPIEPEQPVEPLLVNLTAVNSLKKINLWCKMSNIKWVQLQIDLDLKSKEFFKVESLLRSKGIQYILSSRDAKKDNHLTLNPIPGPPVIPSF